MSPVEQQILQNNEWSAGAVCRADDGSTHRRIDESTNRRTDCLFFYHLIHHIFPKREGGAHGASQRQRPMDDRGLNGRKPLWGRLVVLLGWSLALFHATSLHDAQSCLYFLCFATVFDSVLLLFELNNH